MKRRLVICADGTWNEPDKESDDYEIRRPTNIVKIARAIHPVSKIDGFSQIVFYDRGVGTFNLTDKIFGGLTGSGVVDNILAAYRFLVHNYQDGDEIYLFGFSRGAFTVRSLSGLIAAIGLLPKDNLYWLPEGYEKYRTETNAAELSKYRNLNLSMVPKIKAIGVFDTVGALGIPASSLKGLNRKRHGFHNTELSENIENAFHALAIDEKRKAFIPTLWDKKAMDSQLMEQVWFAGVHSGVGGSYRDDSLANCALHWMIDRTSKLGLDYDDQYLNYFGANPHGPLYESRKGFYRFLPKVVRRIGGSAEQFQSIHTSAKARFDKQQNEYKPENLKDHLKSLDGD